MQDSFTSKRIKLSQKQLSNFEYIYHDLDLDLQTSISKVTSHDNHLSVTQNSLHNEWTKQKVLQI